MRQTSTYRTKKEQLQQVLRDYQEETGLPEIEMEKAAAWAIGNGRWAASRKSAIRACAQELARAAAADYYTDPQGRVVRRNYVIRIARGSRQLSIWADIDHATPAHMKLSLQQRRSYIVGDCRQLKADLDSYNDNNRHGVQLSLSLDFTDDVAERELPTEYPDTKPTKDEHS